MLAIFFDKFHVCNIFFWAQIDSIEVFRKLNGVKVKISSDLSPQGVFVVVSKRENKLLPGICNNPYFIHAQLTSYQNCCLWHAKSSVEVF